MKDITLDSYLEKQLKSYKFKKEWDKLKPQYQITRELIKARIEEKTLQRELAKKANTTQVVISRIENTDSQSFSRLTAKDSRSTKQKA